MISPYLWATLVALVALSAFFSATEMAYSSANRMRLEAAAENGVKIRLRSQLLQHGTAVLAQRDGRLVAGRFNAQAKHEG